MKNSFGLGGDSFSGNFADQNNNQIGCGYSNNTPGSWSGAAVVAANTFGGGGDQPTQVPSPGDTPGTPPADNRVPCAARLNTLLVGNPINAATGNKYETDTDVTCATPTGISLTRYYNSQDTSQSPFGKGWHSTWHRGLKLSGTQVTVTRADGRQDIFTQSGTNTYTPDPDVTSVLAPILGSSGQLSGWTLTLADDTVETYLVGGQLSSVTTRAGLRTTLSYDSTVNYVTRVTGPFGHVMGFTYDGNNHVTSMTAPDGGLFGYNYDANNNLTSVTYPDGTRKQYLYENTSLVNAMTGIIDELGNRFATYAYDAQGRAISTQHAGGAELTTVAYNANGSSTVTDANGNSYTIGTATQFGLVKASTVSGAPAPSLGGSAFTYDANGFIASRTDFDGNVTAYTHDARGDETSRTEAAGTKLARSTTVVWDSTFHLPTLITDPSGRTTAFTYDSHGNLLTKTVTSGKQVRSWQYTYNTNGQVLAEADPNGNVTRFSYDSKGDLASKTDALGHVTRYTAYDGDGYLLSSTDPNGLVTNLTYDSRKRIRTVTVGTEKTSFTYDAAGNLLGVTKPDGSVTSNAYDMAHRLTGLRDSLGNGLAFALDGNDNRVQVGAYDPANNLVQTRRFAYDNVNRLAAGIGAQGQETDYSHDRQGNLTGVSDALGHKTSYAYDSLNRRIQETNAIGGNTGYGYDALDHLVAEQDPKGLLTQYGYDGLDDQTQIASPDTGNTIKTYDNAGNVITSIDARGYTTRYSYDALNRVTKALYADGTSSTYIYDQGQNGIGHLTRMIDPAGVTTWAYDAHGHILSKSQQTNNITLTTRYAYDNVGQLISITYPSGKVVGVHYDADGQVNGLSLGNNPLIRDVHYRPFGPVEEWGQGNNASFSRAFDGDGRITQINMGGIATITYAYDAANRITSQIETGQPGQAFGYDALDRLTAFAEGNTQTNYAYDADGNRLNLATPAAQLTETYGYPANSNHLLTMTQPAMRDDHDHDWDQNQIMQHPQGGQSSQAPANGQQQNQQPKLETLAFTYDADGNTLSDGTHVFAYDARGRLQSAISAHDVNDFHFDQGNREAHHGMVYGINGLGERIIKVASNHDDHDWDDFMRGFGQGAVEYVYDENQHLIGEYDAHGHVIHETVYLGDLPVVVLDGTNTGFATAEYRNPTEVHYISTDRLGAPHIITDARNRKVWEWNHAPFGDTQPTEVQGIAFGAQQAPNQSHTPQGTAQQPTNFAPVAMSGFSYDLRFPGQIHDAETGLNYNLFRDYNPRLARYAESDLAGLIAGVNTYAYVLNNALVYSDPLGLGIREDTHKWGQIACVLFHFCTGSDTGLPQTPIDQPQFSEPAPAPTQQAPLPSRQPQKPKFCPPNENPGTGNGNAPVAGPDGGTPATPNALPVPGLPLPPSFIPPIITTPTCAQFPNLCGLPGNGT